MACRYRVICLAGHTWEGQIHTFCDTCYNSHDEFNQGLLPVYGNAEAIAAVALAMGLCVGITDIAGLFSFMWLSVVCIFLVWDICAQYWYPQCVVVPSLFGWPLFLYTWPRVCLIMALILVAAVVLCRYGEQQLN